MFDSLSIRLKIVLLSGLCLLGVVGLIVGPLFVVAEWAFALGLRKEVQAAIEQRSGPVRLRTGQAPA